MKEFALFKVNLDRNGSLRPQSTDVETLIWLYDLIAKNVAVQKTIDRLQFSFELIVDNPQRK